MFEDSIIVMKTPALRSIGVDSSTFAFIEVWAAMVDWKKYTSIVVIDIENVYFMLFDRKTTLLSRCYIGFRKNGNWYLSANAKEAEARTMNVLKLLSSNPPYYDISVFEDTEG